MLAKGVICLAGADDPDSWLSDATKGGQTW
jgi:hypothetical protein